MFGADVNAELAVRRQLLQHRGLLPAVNVRSSRAAMSLRLSLLLAGVALGIGACWEMSSGRARILFNSDFWGPEWFDYSQKDAPQAFWLVVALHLLGALVCFGTCFIDVVMDALLPSVDRSPPPFPGEGRGASGEPPPRG